MHDCIIIYIHNIVVNVLHTSSQNRIGMIMCMHDCAGMVYNIHTITQ